MEYKNKKIIGMFFIAMTLLFSLSFISAGTEGSQTSYMDLDKTSIWTLGSFLDEGSEWSVYITSKDYTLYDYNPVTFLDGSNNIVSYELSEVVSGRLEIITYDISFSETLVFSNGDGDTYTLYLEVGQPPVLKFGIADIDLEWNDYGQRNLPLYFENYPQFQWETGYNDRFRIILDGTTTLFLGDGVSSLNPEAVLELTDLGAFRVWSEEDNGQISVEARAYNKYGHTSTYFDVNIYDEAEPEPTEPTITTISADTITEDSARLRAELSVNDYSNIDVSFDVRETEGSWWNTGVFETTSNSGTYFFTVTGLDSDTEYEYRAKIDYNSETKYGSIVSFTTLAEEPVNDWETTSPNLKTTTGAFDETIEYLIKDTDYEFQACVYYGEESPYQDEFICGDTLEFTTLDISEPMINTLSAVNIIDIGARLRGELTDLGEFASVNVLFEYRETGATSWTETSTETLTATGTFFRDLSNLDPNTEYDYRARVNFDGLTKFAGTETFTTLDEGIEPTAPQLIKEINDFDMHLNQEINIDLEEYFNNFVDVDIQIDGDVIPYPATLIDSNFENVLSIDVIAKILNLNSYDIEEEYEFIVSALNNHGSVSTQFTLRVMEEPEIPIEPVEPTILSPLVNLFIDLFPDSEGLSLAQRLGFVIIIMLIVTILIIAVGYSSTGELPTAMIYLSMIINFVIFIFFMGIGYIPLSFIIWIALGLIAIAFLRLYKGGGSE